MEFSLFYFAGDGDQPDTDPGYRLLLEGAQYADKAGFTAVWTPERHFHPFGGRYPNPAVTGAAVAAVTERIGIRAGSVVAPLHHVLRIAEEWAVVDNLSGGRVGLSLAAGWNPRDFVLRPGGYADRRADNLATIETLRALWRGDPYVAEAGDELRCYPRPTGPLALWLTCSGRRREGFRAAGTAGVGVLTHLVTQDLARLADNVAEYRSALAVSGSKWPGHVTLMLHTYLANDMTACSTAREPLQRYLACASSMVRPNAGSVDPGSPAIKATAERYLTGDGLIGSVADGAAMVERCRDAGVDEIACLIDFGMPADAVLGGLEPLAELRTRMQAQGVPA